MTVTVADQVLVAQQAERAAVEALGRCQRAVEAVGFASSKTLAWRMVSLGEKTVVTAQSWVDKAKEAYLGSGEDERAAQALVGAAEARDQARAAVAAAQRKVELMGADGGGDVLWMCDVCSRWVRPGDGYLSADQTMVAAVAEATASWRAAHGEDGFTMSELLAMPEPARWKVFHTGCAPEVNDYTIAVEQVATIPDVLDWTLHLMGKNWLGDTNWDWFIRERVFEGRSGVGA